MPKPIKAKIDVTKILKDRLFQGKKGIYLDLVIWPNKGGVGQFGDTHLIKQGLSKEAREAGEEEPIIGSLTMPDEDAPPRQQQRQQAPQRPARQAPRPPADPDLDAPPDDIPFAILFPILIPAITAIQLLA